MSNQARAPKPHPAPAPPNSWARAMGIPPAVGAPNDENLSHPPDWNRIEAAFRAGSMSLRQIGAAHGISEGTIRARAKKAGWVRENAQDHPKCANLRNPEATGGPSIHPGIRRELDTVAARIAALETIVSEMGELLADVAALNPGALWERRAMRPGVPARVPTRWG